MTHFAEIDYGFEWGVTKIERIASDEKRGWVVIKVTTPRDSVYLHVTRTGLIRVKETGE